MLEGGTRLTSGPFEVHAPVAPTPKSPEEKITEIPLAPNCPNPLQTFLA